MNKVLVVYNICGIQKDNTNIYPKYLSSLVNQVFDGQVKIVVSACLPRKHTIDVLKNKFPKLDYLVINDNLPVNITCNKAILESIKRYGVFDAYTYVACDAMMTTPFDLLNLFNSLTNDVGIVSAQIDQDSCYAYGLKLGGGRHVIDDERARQEMFANKQDYIVPVGRACAAHVNMWSNKIQQYYGKCIPDIFKGYCTESVYSFVCAAIKTKWVISYTSKIAHSPSLDGPSCGQNPEGNRALKNCGYDHPFYGDTLLPIFMNDYAKSIGLGYEECQNIVNHDPSQFDENEFCKNELLKEYIKENLYLSKDKFDYDKIDCYYA